MNLRPEDIRSKAFPLRRQGYDPDLVQAFLADVALELEANTETAAADSIYVHYEGELKSLLQIASGKVERIQAEGEAEIRRMRADAEAEIHQVREAAAQDRAEAEALCHEARAEANKIIEVTRRQAEQQRAAVQREAQAMVAEAEATAAEMVAQAQQRVDQLRVLERAVMDCLHKADGFVAQAMSWLGANEDPAGSNGHDTTPVHAAAPAPEDAPSWWARPRHDIDVPSPRGNGKPSNGNGRSDR